MIRGPTRKERLETARRWIDGWSSVPALASLLHNPLHVKLLCRVQRTRSDTEGLPWYLTAELPLEPRELLISELHRHAITPILLRKDNFDFAAGTVFGELELIKSQAMSTATTEDKAEQDSKPPMTPLLCDWPNVNAAMAAVTTASAAAILSGATEASDSKVVFFDVVDIDIFLTKIRLLLLLRLACREMELSLRVFANFSFLFGTWRTPIIRLLSLVRVPKINAGCSFCALLLPPNDGRSSSVLLPS